MIPDKFFYNHYISYSIGEFIKILYWSQIVLITKEEIRDTFTSAVKAAAAIKRPFGDMAAIVFFN